MQRGNLENECLVHLIILEQSTSLAPLLPDIIYKIEPFITIKIRRAYTFIMLDFPDNIVSIRLLRAKCTSQVQIWHCCVSP